MTPHNEAKKEDIKKTVIMPGDPLRAKYIAEHFLENPRLVNSIRNMYAYTGTYKGVEVTVFSHGMGIPSMGIYSYELFKYYGVENIIRIGSCGAYNPNLRLLDTVMVNLTYTESNFAYTYSGVPEYVAYPDTELNNLLRETAKENNIDLKEANCFCTDWFDKYVDDIDSLLSRLPKEYNLEVAEMESFALFYNAKTFRRKAACLLSVVDTVNDGESVAPEKREQALNDMIVTALETAIKL